MISLSLTLGISKVFFFFDKFDLILYYLTFLHYLRRIFSYFALTVSVMASEVPLNN
jgi:hypothetical protein